MSIVPKEEIKYVFNPYVLKPGDILLMNTYEERLREKMNCTYEHAAIYIGDAYIMEANGLHVIMSHIYSYAFREKSHAFVLRMKNYSPINMEDVARNARKQMGRDYVDTKQFRYVRAFKDTDRKDNSNRSFCSRLVAQCYDSENIKLVPNPDYCEPDDFLKSDKLEAVSNAVVPFSDELEKVVMHQQEQRISEEIESPNSEMFDALSGVYNEDIQDSDQMIIAALKKPECSDRAIDVINASSMFKHKEFVDKNSPWFWNDDDFLNQFKDDESALHYIYSSLNHYDNTLIPSYREFHAQMIFLADKRKECKVIVFMRDYISKMVDEAIECRIRLEKLYELMQNSRSDGFNAFVKEYGIYKNYKYVDKPLDISFIFRDLMKMK